MMIMIYIKVKLGIFLSRGNRAFDILYHTMDYSYQYLLVSVVP